MRAIFAALALTVLAFVIGVAGDLSAPEPAPAAVTYANSGPVARIRIPPAPRTPVALAAAQPLAPRRPSPVASRAAPFVAQRAIAAPRRLDVAETLAFTEPAPLLAEAIFAPAPVPEATDSRASASNAEKRSVNNN